MENNFQNIINRTLPDREHLYASSSFINWIKDSAIANGNSYIETKKASNSWASDDEIYHYELYGYQLTWNPRSMMNQFYLYVPSENDSFIVTVNNTFYKIPSSEKVGIN